ncbi:exosome 3'-_5 exonuclease subunit ski4 (Csl4) [Bachmanniomyces sp. S44760]|nr:exosome 3'->5 exonuclease subunit ski4 (Csl4) [Bachmanniomyces sp. S44760]
MSTTTTYLNRPSPLRNLPQSLNCPKCGTDIPHTPHTGQVPLESARIAELEDQVKVLTIRATAAVEKVADYEDELHKIKSARHVPPDINTTGSPYPVPLVSSPGRNRDSASFTNRIHALLPTHHNDAATQRSASQPPPSSAPAHKSLHPPQTALLYPQTATGMAYPSPQLQNETDLLTALTQEQQLRHAAESQQKQTSDEIEELTGQLFQQANEMVAEERKSKARLEERVNQLQQRDGDKRSRLELLETRLNRIERVNKLLGKT